MQGSPAAGDGRVRAQRQEKTHSVASIGGRQLHDRYMDNTNVEVRKKQSVLMYQKRNVLNNSESILFTLYLFERRKSLYALYDIDGFFLFARSGAHLLVAALMTLPPPSSPHCLISCTTPIHNICHSGISQCSPNLTGKHCPPLVKLLLLRDLRNLSKYEVTDLKMTNEQPRQNYNAK